MIGSWGRAFRRGPRLPCPLRKDVVAMGCFPLFVDLSGRKVLIAGGGKVAERKADALLEFGASVWLVSPKATGKLRRLAASGKIHFLEREYRPGDLQSAALAVAATGNREVNRGIRDEAVRRAVPVNVADDPELCTFLFPAVVHRKDFVVGITTSGSYPALSKYARRKIEALFPENYGKMVTVLKSYRAKVRREIQDPALRRAVLEELLQMAVRADEESEWTAEGAFCPCLSVGAGRCPEENRTEGREACLGDPHGRN